jgi:hypothetical protein
VNLDHEKLLKAANIRRHGRLPTAVYVFKPKGHTNRSKGSVLWRSSEPKNELMTMPSDEDREMIKLMAQTL